MASNEVSGRRIATTMRKLWHPFGCTFLLPRTSDAADGITINFAQALTSHHLHGLLQAPQNATGIRRGVTTEGEHYVGYHCDGSLVSAIIGDYHQSRIETRSSDPTVVAFYQWLVPRFELKLGHNRARRFEFEPPRDWMVSHHGLTSIFHYPNLDAKMTVSPAAALADDSLVGRLLYEDVRFEFTPASDPHVQPIRTSSGLTGTLYSLSGLHFESDDVVVVHAAILADQRFKYRVVCETSPIDNSTNDMIKADFLQLLATVQPIPTPTSLPGGKDQWAFIVD